jgi:hypothetical protein
MLAHKLSGVFFWRFKMIKEQDDFDLATEDFFENVLPVIDMLEEKNEDKECYSQTYVAFTLLVRKLALEGWTPCELAKEAVENAQDQLDYEYRQGLN